jgi:hypothetical protein
MSYRQRWAATHTIEASSGMAVPSHTDRPSRGPRSPIGLLLAALALVACDGLTGADCTLELGIDLRPRGEQQLAVGASFTGSVALSSCGGRERLSDTFAWSGRDTLVVRVEAATGRVTGRAPGSTFVDVRGTRYGPLGTIPVVVR